MKRPAAESFLTTDEPDAVRRRLLRYGLNGLGAIACGKLLLACNGTIPEPPLELPPVSLLDSGVENLLLPEGFSARVIARSGHPVLEGHDFNWHAAPDGGAVFSVEDGWIYVSNSEMDNGAGGVSAIRFNQSGDIVAAYPILSNTSRNCAGGPTPWNTWLSCEEIPEGQVWECDPRGEQAARVLPALGTFMHEAAAVDPETFRIYMTEDRPDGRFYRFTPAGIENGMPDLAAGTLEVAAVRDLPEGPVSWHVVEDPSGASAPTRYQVAQSTPFAGGEGAWYADRTIYFTTKRDSRVWAYAIDGETLSLVYDANDFNSPVLTGADNITVSNAGTLYVAEDGGNMEIVAINPGRNVFPVLRINRHSKSEITGPAFDASGRRLYFSSQRGATGSSLDGITYEVTGPFV